jgi:hypothetical protein
MHAAHRPDVPGSEVIGQRGRTAANFRRTGVAAATPTPHSSCGSRGERTSSSTGCQDGKGVDIDGSPSAPHDHQWIRKIPAELDWESAHPRAGSFLSDVPVRTPRRRPQGIHRRTPLTAQGRIRRMRSRKRRTPTTFNGRFLFRGPKSRGTTIYYDPAPIEPNRRRPELIRNCHEPTSDA